MEKIAAALIDGKENFEVWGELDSTNLFDSDFLRVTVDGEEKDDFGSFWSGVRISAAECAEMIIRAFINDDEHADFSYVHPAIIDYKQKTITHKLAAPDVPDQFVCSDGHVAHLAAYSDNGLYYLGNESIELFIVTDRNHNLLTSYENFFVNAIVTDYKDDKLKFIDGVFESDVIENWIKEFLY